MIQELIFCGVPRHYEQNCLTSMQMADALFSHDSDIENRLSWHVRVRVRRESVLSIFSSSSDGGLGGTEKFINRNTSTIPVSSCRPVSIYFHLHISHTFSCCSLSKVRVVFSTS
jgi:hypothetical protein